jgi:hypothetical protein
MMIKPHLPFLDMPDIPSTPEATTGVCVASTFNLPRNPTILSLGKMP